MQVFLSGREYREALAELAEASPSLDIAVAFLGGGASDLIAGVGDGRLLCNLESGATNPSAVRAIQKSCNVQTRTLPSLHAKLLIGREAVICGSANLSANGLGLEGEETHGWWEAGILSRDPAIVRDARDWFIERWDQARAIDEETLLKAEQAWSEQRRHGRFPPLAQVEQSSSIGGEVAAADLAGDPRLERLEAEGEIWELVREEYPSLAELYRELRMKLHQHAPMLRAERESGGKGWIKFRITGSNGAGRQFARFGLVLKKRTSRIEVWFKANEVAPAEAEVTSAGLEPALGRKQGKAFYLANPTDVDDTVVRWLVRAV